MQSTTNLRIKRNLTALIEFSRVINSSVDLGFILNNVLLTCLGKFLSTRGLIAISENGSILIKKSKGLPNDLLAQFPDLKSSTDVFESSDFVDYLNKANLLAFEKICSSDDCMGIVCLGEKLNKSEYTEDDREFLKTILNISASAIQNSMMFAELKKVNRELDSRIQRLNTLFELSKEFGLFSESTRVARLLMYSVIGQFLVSKFAVVTYEAGEYKILESKYEPDKILKLLHEYELEKFSAAINKERIASEFEKLNQLDVDLIVPMQLQGKTRGLILLGKRINNQPYNATDIEFVYSVGSLAIISLENKKLFQEALEKQKLEEELDLARDIQKNLFPQSLPKIKGVDVSAINISSKQVGGDYYDVIPIDENRFIIAIADVSGKGVPASLLMANIQAFLQVISKMDMDIENATALMNNLITENTSDGRFITFFWGLLDIKNLTFNYVNAGHNPPLFIRNKNIKKLGRGGIILGVMKTIMPYESENIQLESGDVILLFTDGISEAMNLQGVEYSDTKLENKSIELSGNSAGEILIGIKDDVQNFTTGNFQSDDITMIVLKIE
jgi:phosphoserine phosphatase RsbU/P